MAENPTTLLSAQNPHFSCEGERLRAEFLLSLSPGEVAFAEGVEGGAGDALLLLLCGLHPPLAGRVELLGRDLAGLDENERRALRASCGVALHLPVFVSNMSLRDNLLLPLRARGLSDGEAAAAVGAACERMGLHGGQLLLVPAAADEVLLARASLARVLAVRPRVLLVNDPLQRCGGEQDQDLRSVLAAFARETRCALFFLSSHRQEPRTPGLDGISLHIEKSP